MRNSVVTRRARLRVARKVGTLSFGAIVLASCAAPAIDGAATPTSASSARQPTGASVPLVDQPGSADQPALAASPTVVLLADPVVTTSTPIVPLVVAPPPSPSSSMSTDVAVNTWAAQAAAMQAGLPAGATCMYPPSIAAGETVAISCPTVNPDASEGAWSFVLGADGSVESAASYQETKSAPATTAAATPLPPPQAATDPQFGTCKEAKAHGYGPYISGRDPEYDWYRDADHDGEVCE